MWLICVFAVVSLVVGEQTFHIGLKGKQANLDRYESSCGGKKDMKIVFDTQTLKFEKNVIYTNQTITVTEDIPTDHELKMHIKIIRCKSKENPDTCEEFYKYSINKYCEFLLNHSQFWRPYYESIEPRLVCPLKKGVYKGTNSAIQASTFLMKPAAGYFWKVIVEIFEGDGNDRQLISCTIAEAQVGVSK